MTGDANANVLDGGTGLDVLNGGAGNDTLVSDSVGDTLDGGDGIDTLRMTIASNASTTYQTSAFLSGAPVVIGDGTTVSNFEGFDLTAGGGNDNLLIDSAVGGPLSFNGAGGIDRVTADFSASGTAVSIDDSNLITFAGGSLTAIVEEYWITGGSAGDTLRGGAGLDQLIGSGGNDFLSGLAGGDTLNGGDGDDILCAGSAAATSGFGHYYVVFPPVLDLGLEVDTLFRWRGKRPHICRLWRQRRRRR